MATIESAPTTSPPPVIAQSDVPEVEDIPRTLGGVTLDEVASLVGAAAGALGLVWLAFNALLPWSGGLGFVVCWFVAFLALYATVTSLSNPSPVVIDRLARAVVWAGAAIVGLVIVSAVVYTLSRGFEALVHLNFYTQDMAGVAPTAPLDQGGILHALVGTAIQVGIAALISLPLGVATAVFMTEVGGPLARLVRTVVEAMTALPDILAGLFVYVVLLIALGWERSGFAVSVALCVTMVPIIARSAEVALRIVPGGLREASLALGASQWQTVRQVVLPTARAGLATALILGVARVAGETAPLLIVSGSSTFLNANPLHEPMTSLPMYIYIYVRSGQPLAITRAYGAAAVLLIVVLILFALTRFLARDRGTPR